MRRAVTLACVLALVLGAGGSATADGKSTRTKGAVPLTYHLHWQGDCAGHGYMDFKPGSGDPDDCVTYFPAIADSHAFVAVDGVPLVLDTRSDLEVDFALFSIISVAAEFEAVVTGTLAGKDVEIASASQTILVAALSSTPVHFELEPERSLDNARLDDLTLTLNWTSGVTYSGIEMENATLRLSANPARTVTVSKPAPSLPVPPTKSAPPAAPEPTAVIAVNDSGINPYHVTFRDNSRRAFQHPSTYIPGYPKDAEALPLTLNAPTYQAALLADCERIWNRVEPGKLYWFPGTRVIGGITFTQPGGDPCSATGGGYILDINGHGTMTASRAISHEYGACKECLVVAVQFSASALEGREGIDIIEWAAGNADWIDAQSNSWGPLAPLWEPTGAAQLFTSNPAFVRAVEETAQKHLAFWASGNGALFRFGALGHPTPLAPHLTPSAMMVGGVDSGYVNAWPGFPAHVVSDACNCWAAHHDSIDLSEDTVGSGTSSATPFAAGGAAHHLLLARRILGDTGTGVHNGVVARGASGLVPRGPLADGKFTLEEWKRLVLVTATPRPEAQFEDGPPCDLVDGAVLYSASPVPWSDVPDDYPEYLHIGYGAVDRPAMELAGEILAGRAEMPDRSDTDEFFALDREVRETTYEVWSRP